MYLIKRVIQHGRNVVETDEEKCSDFESAKSIYKKFITRIIELDYLFDNEGHIKRLQRLLVGCGNGQDFSFAFQKSLEEYIKNPDTKNIKPIEIDDEFLYVPGCEDEEEFEDDEAEINAAVNGKQRDIGKAIDNPKLRKGRCGSEGFYIYELVKDEDDELYMYMVPTDHEKEHYFTTGLVECNSFTMDNPNKAYIFRLCEMTNNETYFPHHKDGPTYIVITLEYQE